MATRQLKQAADCTALVVDNDELVRLGTIIMARQLGFNIRTAIDGPSALVLMEGSKLPDLLITDYDMPGMTGVQLAMTITGRRPDVDVLIITGHDTLDEDLPGEWQVLHKPFTSMTLRRTLESFGIRYDH